MTEQFKQPLDPNIELIELMRAREKREAREAEIREKDRIEVAEAHERRVEVRKAGDQFYWDQLHLKQSQCDHRKGTAGPGPKAKHIDYMVSRHVFANSVTQIKCLKCKHRSFPGDTKEKCHGTMENFMANRKAKRPPQLPNLTRLSYNEFYNMTLEENTSNKETRAEIITAGPQPVTA